MATETPQTTPKKDDELEPVDAFRERARVWLADNLPKLDKPRDRHMTLVGYHWSGTRRTPPPRA